MISDLLNQSVAMFAGARSVDPIGHPTIAEVMTSIREPSPAVRKVIAHVRSSIDSVVRGKWKGFLPAIVFAADLHHRRAGPLEDRLASMSGVVCLDLDHLDRPAAEVRDLLAQDPCCLAAFVSPSGDGVKALFALDHPTPAQWAWLWQAAADRLKDRHGFTCDPARKDLVGLCFASHDPDAFIRSGPVELITAAEPQPAPSGASRAEPPPGSDRLGTDVVRRARRYLANMPAAVSGQGGHAATYAAATAMVHGFCLSESEAFDLLSRDFNPRCVPPDWTDAELLHKVREAATKSHNQPRGWLRDEPPPSARPGSADPWPPLAPIGAAAIPPPFDPVAMLPADLPELVHLVESLAEAVQVPHDLVAAAAVGLAALACSRSAEIRCAHDWVEPAPLWVLPLLRPGERKSASLSMLVRPFHAWAADERKAMAEPAARFAERRKTMEARLGALRARAAKAEGEEQRKLEREASDLAADLAALPLRVDAPDLLVQSFTPEGLRDALETNGEKLGIVSAEADAAELLGARYSDAGPNLCLLLATHAGEAITTKRAGGRTVPLDRPAVGMVLVVQPEAVRLVLGDRAAKGRGLIDRMLLILPASRMGSRLLDPPPMPAEVAGWWASALRALLDRPWPGRMVLGYSGDPVRCTSPTRVLILDPEARAILWNLRANIEPRMLDGGDLAAVSGFASKLPGACARIALAFTMLRDPNAETVGAETMRAACAWAPYLLAHHRAVLGDAAEPLEHRHARRLWRALQRHGRSVVTARDMFAMIRDSAVPDMATFRSILTDLADHGAVRPGVCQPDRPGRPAEVWDVHPGGLCDSCGIPAETRGAA